MTSKLPLTQVYNLARLGQAGDALTFAATPEECAAYFGDVADTFCGPDK